MFNKETLLLGSQATSDVNDPRIIMTVGEVIDKKRGSLFRVDIKRSC